MPPELPLLITAKARGGVFKSIYEDVVARARGADAKDFIYAEMGGFVVANAPGEVKFLHTSGALTCTVMCVHMRRGVGALGHFFALGNLKKEVGGIVQMVEACNALTGDTAHPVSIALSAAEAGKDFAQKMIAAIKTLYPGCSCHYVADTGQSYGACVYVPQLYRAAFCDDYIRGTGPKRSLQRLSEYAYDERDADLVN